VNCGPGELKRSPEEGCGSDSLSADRVRWNRITELVADAWDMDPAERDAFLASACSGDESLRQEVLILLKDKENLSGFLEHSLPAGSDPIQAGATIGSYEIEDKLGEGGMGVVYRARDTRLERTVAIKIVRIAGFYSQHRRERFLCEARTTAALNHPNIVTIHDVGSAGEIDFIAMEYVPGVTLDKLLSEKRLPVADVLRYGEQIACALAYAHARRIIHRDLKPGNIIITESGAAKVLDFGLAKRLGEFEQPAGHEGTPRNRAGTTSIAGVIAGTVSYMSPEQTQGKKLDERSDIFSFGSVLFEMATGRKAFAGSGGADTLAMIREGNGPAFSEWPSNIPLSVRRLARACLARDVERRPQSAVEAHHLLQKANAAFQARKRVRIQILSLVAGLAAIAALLVFPATLRNRRATGIPMAVPFATAMGVNDTPSFSPDGSKVVFTAVGVRDKHSTIYWKDLHGGNEVRMTRGLRDDINPVWGPGGAWIAYRERLDDGRTDIRLVRPTGTDDHLFATTAPDLPCTTGMTWANDGKSLIISDREGSGQPAALFRFAFDTGQRQKVTRPPLGSLGDCGPSVSPDGRLLAFARWQRYEVSDVYLQPLRPDNTAAGPASPLTSGNKGAVSTAWTPDGRYVLFSAPFDDAKLWRVRCCRLTAPEFLSTGGENAHHPAISKTGDIVFSRQVLNIALRELRLNDRYEVMTGPALLPGSSGVDSVPDLSPDGRRLAFASNRSGSYEIWTADADGEAARQLTRFGAHSGHPTWSPDGRRIAFQSNRSGAYQIYLIASGEQDARPFTSGPGSHQAPRWSADGNWLYFQSNRDGRDLLYRMALAGGEIQPAGPRDGPLYEPWPARDGLYFVRGASRQRRLCWSNEDGTDENCQAELVHYSAFAILDGARLFVTHAADSDKWEIRRVRGNQSSSRLLFAAPWPVGSLSVSRDGHKIVFSTQQQWTKDLFLTKLPE